MKKSVKILSLLVAIILISGCSGKDKEFVKNCSLTASDVTSGYKLETKYKIYGKGKVVDKVNILETVITDDESTIDYFEEYLKESYKKLNDTYSGYTNKITKEDGKIISDTTVDYNKMDIEQYVKDNSAMKNFVNSDNKISVDGIINIYEALGATCK